MPSSSRLIQKQKYETKLVSCLETFDKGFIVKCDNVRSKQFQDIRQALRPKSVILMGKNTMMKRCIRAYIERTGVSKWQPLLDELVGNVGIIFTKDNLNDLRETIGQFTVPAPAKAGAIAPRDVVVQAGPTGMGPETTSFFQVLNIATKINKGTVEILNNLKIISAGEKVSSSAAALMGKLKMMPFEYGLVVRNVFEGETIYSPQVLDITDEDLKISFSKGVSRVAALSLAASYPTLASVPHSIVNGYKSVLSVSISTNYTFSLAQKVKDYLANPSAFAAAAAPVASTGGAGGEASAAPAPAEEEEEESEEEQEFDLFD